MQSIGIGVPRFPLRGGMSPPMRTTSISAPLWVSPSLSPSSSSSSSSSAPVSSPLLVASWRSCLWSCLLGGEVPAASSHCFLRPTSTSSSAAPSYAPPSPDPLGGSGLLSMGCRGLVVTWASPRQYINYLVNYPTSLFLWCPPPPYWGWCAFTASPSWPTFPCYPLTPTLSCSGAPRTIWGFLSPPPPAGLVRGVCVSAWGVPPPLLVRRYPPLPLL